MNIKKDQTTKEVEQKSNALAEINMYENSELFSDTTMSEIDNSYKFWNEEDEHTSIFDICKEFESSEEEYEKRDVRKKSQDYQKNNSIEINTMPLENTTQDEQTNDFEKETY
ncbi:hypothetical protein PFAG_03767 [Plasmodium falciparum Santa Lucia]|uniref:Uncharacterized protein n=13 Tax=Plasmodium falciparum TaxID=5833 RepID=Q8I5S2_PLAF7|nr:conserved Plasmodium protein, unknown function [Plasmodium falciparum 3D7]ETW17740.1 hypothetical protein PFFVO_03388 [Plasmodium falciparum Vietnam Oak-Knoll (FVO)]ETW41783.1 hypothetical protein PFNF135_03935 [Plasmodium falciparum NF135/5.C10]ETW48276.1 hypothetical protein PFMALIP_03675 [Plasmodium falciparum MaliPS096_E11]ETW60427.1 hypothetical protein PFMC_03706 [Plasmodium falciparum CAMP/Malaysia]EUR69276.1 hypothetical protein PFBG_03828 [Plasmodium falciparum 7G8]EUT83020.1 hypo|eukprot:XP_001350538.1 conserved Plasmodium protein, unknown function [Plasmodium falciparum 3D7]